MALPSLFVSGDSISIQYGPHLECALKGVFEYSRKTGEEEALKNLDLPTGANGGDSERQLEYFSALRDDKTFKPDVILLNCGLHDIKVMELGQANQVSIDDYKENLQKITKIIEEIGSALIWIRTTPVNEAMHSERKPFHRLESDVARYNEVADQVMRDAGAAICDLFTYTANLDGDITNDGVHFVEEVRPKQAAFIAGFVNASWQDAR